MDKTRRMFSGGWLENALSNFTRGWFGTATVTVSVGAKVNLLGSVVRTQNLLGSLISTVSLLGSKTNTESLKGER